MSAPSQMLTASQVAARLGVSAGVIRRALNRGELPSPVILVGRPRWHVDVIDEWARGRASDSSNDQNTH